ncbi:hypothetical protein SAMN04490243_1192 [Robiginitalea myxolifaciens]|uniref:Uncharacterized protein n=1 Tax=Robiginitalea myxolifaciens TaxID=400055 RepID=A0A1I6G404_9FLAO|nr:hypothetical protein [Robiginitalea myxolifaciens]SFR36840.1 hypothetical protein SAMN04490243_1192 [Robiginitalea myxolifaciens]
MKRALLILAIILLISNKVKSQEDIIGDALWKYKLDLEGINKSRVQDDQFELTFNPRTLNYYFGNILTNYIATPETPATREWTAVLNSESNSVEFGYSFDLRDGALTDYIKQLYYVGLRAQAEKEGSFFPLLDIGDVNSSYGADLRFTKIFSFKRRFKPKAGSRKKIQDFRNNQLWGKVRSSLENEASVDTKKANNTIAKTMNDFIEANELDLRTMIFWFNLRAFLPINQVDYTYIENESIYMEENELSEEFRNWSFTSSLNGLLKYKKWSGTASVIFNYFNNNNILTKEITKTTFTQLVENPTDDFIPLKTKQVFVGDYEEFWTPQIKGEITTLYKKTIGFSIAGEFNTGEYYENRDVGRKNWKMGIPVSLKDKDGKSTINFEIQWRELNGDHFVGVRLGKTFGSFID